MEKRKNCWLIPTDKPSRLCIGHESKLWLTQNELLYIKDDNFKTYPQNIYILSDEVIKEGDYFFNRNFTEVHKCIEIDSNGDLLYNRINRIVSKHAKKIILTTEIDLIKDGVQRIDDEFLEWFVKNPSFERVEVNIEGYPCMSDGSEITFAQPANLGGSEDIRNNIVSYNKQEHTDTKNFVKAYDKKRYKIIIPNLEIWKDIPEFKGYYQVSNLGNVKSLSRIILGRGKHDTLLKERLLKFSTSTNGYYQVILQKEGFKKIYKVHSLVAICFLNHTPDGTHNIVIDHINEVKTDNRLENLKLIGHRENVARSMKNNTSTYVGVSWSKNAKKWISQITIKGKTKYLGLFDNEEDANKKYLETLKDL